MPQKSYNVKTLNPNQLPQRRSRSTMRKGKSVDNNNQQPKQQSRNRSTSRRSRSASNVNPRANNNIVRQTRTQSNVRQNRTTTSNNNNNTRKNRGQSVTFKTNTKPIRKQTTPPNYVYQNGKNYSIGPESDARLHQGWRKTSGKGSNLQFSFIPRMANRVDQAYYKLDIPVDSRNIDTFAVSIMVQDSSLPRNFFKTLKPEDGEKAAKYLQNLSTAFDAFLKRTSDMVSTATYASAYVQG